MMYRSERPDKGTIVYVGGLAGDVQKSDLEAEFEKFGEVKRVWVAFNPPGFAFVEFPNKEDAESAVNALHNATVLGSKLRVEISRGRARGGRGGMPGRGSSRGSFGGDRGSFRGRGDFRGGRGGNGFGRGFGRGFGGRPFDREEEFKPFRRDSFGDRFDSFDERRRPEFDDSDFGMPRDFGARREPIGRDYGEMDDLRGFGGGRDMPLRDVRDYGHSGRDFPPRDTGDRDFAAPRGGGRDFGGREMNGVRSFGGARDLPPVERPFAGGGRDFGVSQATIGRDFGAARDVAPVRDFEEGRDFPVRDLGPGRGEYGGVRSIGRDAGGRDFPPRDLGDPRDFAGRPSRMDFADDRFGGVGRGGYGDGGIRRAGGFNDNYGARDRFRSRSPIGRVSRPIY